MEEQEEAAPVSLGSRLSSVPGWDLWPSVLSGGGWASLRGDPGCGGDCCGCRVSGTSWWIPGSLGINTSRC